MPPAAPVIATTFPAKLTSRAPHGGTDPVETVRADEAVVIKGDVLDAGGPQPGDRRDDLALRLEVRMRWPEDAADRAFAADAPLHIPGIGLHPLGIGLV